MRERRGGGKGGREATRAALLFVTSLKSVKSGEAEASSQTGTIDEEEGIGRLFIGGDDLEVESDGLEQETADISRFVRADGTGADFFTTET
ncbi:hypothetical protein AVEN_272489-1 [Araneus ventricosus]|uniref:Uncharacterized protein n=1 Tax=Araneus ventricosus TaxID=182803 RepID=A0A4Y2TV26_ARAVE|nr:hypothetical protein AVEN_272489-1 [Araneus ventricosus]